MAVIGYNGIYLPYPVFTEFRQEAVYDEMGGTDLYLLKFDITVQAILHATYLDMVFPLLTGTITNPAIIMRAIRSRLMRPRRELVVSVNGENLIPEKQLGNTGYVDAKNGPKPEYCSIHQLTSTSFLLQYRITAHYWESNEYGVQYSTNAPGNPILNTRWSETVEIDDCGLSKKTREGIIRMRSDNPEGLTIDSYRDKFAVTTVPEGFLRESARYTVSPDGLSLRFTIVDKESINKPPEPAYKAEGYYLEQTTKLGVARFGEVHITLYGNKDTGMTTMINVGLLLCLERLRDRGHLIEGHTSPKQKGGGWAWVEFASVKYYLYEKNQVEITIRAYMPGVPKRFVDKTGNPGGGGAIQAFTDITGYSVWDDNDYVPEYKTYGNNDTRLKAAAYFDPNNTSTELNKDTGQLSQGVQVGEAGVTPEPEELIST